MYPARIAELLDPFLSFAINLCHSERGQRPGEACPEQSRRESAVVLSTIQLQHISTYIDILLRWNARINLTAIRNEEELVTRHFGESLFAARHLFPVGAQPETLGHVGTAAPGCPVERSSTIRVADLGSGAGFPGIPIKLWAPNISMTLIESNHKKATFLREVARSLTLTDINIQNTRAEDLIQTYDVVTLRAVERFTEALPVAARLLTPNGRLALLIAASQVAAVRPALPHLAWADPIPVPQSNSRLLLLSDPVPNE
jgi:16S rRNA (guanine527-N7)-methyltransferase